MGVGGAYFLVARSLGLEIGGSIGVPPYWAQAVPYFARPGHGPYSARLAANGRRLAAGFIRQSKLGARAVIASFRQLRPPSSRQFRLAPGFVEIDYATAGFQR